MSKLLVVVDMQNDFIDGSLGSEEALNIVENVCEKIRTFDGDIAITMDTHDSSYENTLEGKNLPVRHCMKETYGWKLNHKVKKAIEDTNRDCPVFLKFDSFGSYELASFLRDSNYESVEFIGLCTDICVISNAMLAKTFVNNTPVYVDSSCCAGVTPQSHKNALDAMKMCHINIL